MLRVVLCMSTTDAGLKALIVKPDGGSAVPLLGMWHKVDAGHLDGRLLVMEGEIQPGQLIVPHTHTREDECAYVLSGELTYQLGDEVRPVTAGSYVVKPRGIRHAFWNSGAQPARVVEMLVPATFGSVLRGARSDLRGRRAGQLRLATSVR